MMWLKAMGVLAIGVALVGGTVQLVTAIGGSQEVAVFAASCVVAYVGSKAFG